MTTPPPPPPDEGLDAFRPPPPPPEPEAPPSDTPTDALPSADPPGGSPPPDPSPSDAPTDALPSASTGPVYRHTSADDDTTVLAPVTSPTNILDRIPLSERKRWTVLFGGAGILAVLLLGFAVYLLVINNQWSEREFAAAGQLFRNYDFSIEIDTDRLEALRGFLIEKRVFLLRLLENPSLLEHESFTDLLWAITHLAEELAHRKDVRKLPETDYQHLANDIKRAYGLLVSQWIAYMKHMKGSYPYLFSLAVRTNPFDPDTSVEIR